VSWSFRGGRSETKRASCTVYQEESARGREKRQESEESPTANDCGCGGKGTTSMALNSLTLLPKPCKICQAASNDHEHRVGGSVLWWDSRRVGARPKKCGERAGYNACYYGHVLFRRGYSSTVRSRSELRVVVDKHWVLSLLLGRTSSLSDDHEHRAGLSLPGSANTEG
jgi:hypothetical protein